MIKIDTGVDSILRYDDCLTQEQCAKIINCIPDHIFHDNFETISDESDGLPWNTQNNFYWQNIQDEEVREIIRAHRWKVCERVNAEMNFDSEVYPHFTDICIWQPGISMGVHTDDGEVLSEEHLYCRHASSITYLNDNYKGGYTFIEYDDRRETYYSRPKSGSCVMFYSDMRSPHGVTEVIGNPRITMALWMTMDKNEIEPDYHER